MTRSRGVRRCGRPRAHDPALRHVRVVTGHGAQIEDGFELSEYDPDRPLELGPFTVSFSEVPHYIRAWGCDLRSDDGRRLTFGADCGPNDAIVELARDTDLMMLEATEGAGPHVGGAFRGHLTAGEAGELARRAGAGAAAADALLGHARCRAAAERSRSERSAGLWRWRPRGRAT